MQNKCPNYLPRAVTADLSRVSSATKGKNLWQRGGGCHEINPCRCPVLKGPCRSPVATTHTRRHFSLFMINGRPTGGFVVAPRRRDPLPPRLSDPGSLGPSRSGPLRCPRVFFLLLSFSRLPLRCFLLFLFFLLSFSRFPLRCFLLFFPLSFLFLSCLSVVFSYPLFLLSFSRLPLRCFLLFLFLLLSFSRLPLRCLLLSSFPSFFYSVLSSLSSLILSSFFFSIPSPLFSFIISSFLFSVSSSLFSHIYSFFFSAPSPLSSLLFSSLLPFSPSSVYDFFYFLYCSLFTSVPPPCLLLFFLVLCFFSLSFLPTFFCPFTSSLFYTFHSLISSPYLSQSLPFYLIYRIFPSVILFLSLPILFDPCIPFILNVSLHRQHLCFSGFTSLPLPLHPPFFYPPFASSLPLFPLLFPFCLCSSFRLLLHHQ